MSLGTRIRRIVAALATFTASVSAVAPLARGEVAGLIDDELAVLNPTASYGVIWAPMELEERAAVSALVEEIDDINQYFDLEEEGLIAIARIDRFDRDAATTVYNGGLDAEEVGGPGTMIGRSCFEPIWFTVSSQGITSRSVEVSSTKSSDVEYAPKCPSYPCNRVAKGSSMWDGEFSVATDFFWRSNWNSFNYWTTQSNSGPGWSVSLYSGNSSINYLERSCSGKYYTGITLSWK